MKYYLLKASIDCCDEFDCEMFSILNQDEIDKLMSLVKKYFEKSKDYVLTFVGTNEQLQFDNFQEWRKKITLNEICENTYNILHNLFPKSFGTGSCAIDITHWEERMEYLKDDLRKVD